MFNKKYLNPLTVYTISLIGILACLLPVLFFTGSNAVPNLGNGYIWETAYRMALGHVPHQDFFSPFSFAPYLLSNVVYNIFSWYTTVSIDRAFLIAQCLNTSIAMLIALWFTRGAKSALARLLFVFCVGSLFGSAAFASTELKPKLIFWLNNTDIPYYYFMPTFNGNYYQFGSGALGLLLFRLAYRPHSTKKIHEILDGILVGLLTAAVLFTKTNYFFGVLSFAPLAYYLFPENRRTIHISIIAFFILLLTLEFSYSHVVSGYVLDILTLLQTRHIPFSWHYTIARASFTLPIALPILLFMYLVIAVSSFYYKNDTLKKIFFYLSPWPIVYILISHFDGVPSILLILLSLALYIIVLTDELDEIKSKHIPYTTLSLVIIITFLSMPILARISVNLNAMTTIAHVAASGKNVTIEHTMELDAKKLDYGHILHQETFLKKRARCWRLNIPWDTCFKDIMEKGPKINTTQYMQEGIKLIQKTQQEQQLKIDHLLLVDATNPFTYLFNLTPPKNVPAWLDGVTLSDRCRASAEGLFSYVDYVMVPYYAQGPDLVRDFNKWYNPYLQKHYSLIAKSEYFQLYKRKEMAAPRQKTRRYACIPYR